MKILAISSSPLKKGISVSKMFLDYLVEGMRASGADVDIFDLSEKKVLNCTGCGSCWNVTSGKCVIPDDMTMEIYPKFESADLVVLASPIYFYQINAAMLNFINRTYPFLEPCINFQDGRYFPYRFRAKHPKMMVLTAASCHGEAICEQISSYMRKLYGKDLIAEIHRGDAGVFHYYNSYNSEILDAIKRAGSEIVQSNRISDETMSVIMKPLDDEETLAFMRDMVFKSMNKQKQNVNQFITQGGRLLPDTLKGFLKFMEAAFNAKEAVRTNLTYQFEFSGDVLGDVSGDCQLIIANGALKAVEGCITKPDITIKVPFAIWLDIINGKTSSRQMIIEKKLRVQGDWNGFMKMGLFFGREK